MNKITSTALYEAALKDLDITAQGFRDAAAGVENDESSDAYSFGRSLFRGKVIPRQPVKVPEVSDRALETTAFLAGLYGEPDQCVRGGDVVIAAYRRGVALRFSARIGAGVAS